MFHLPWPVNSNWFANAKYPTINDIIQIINKGIFIIPVNDISHTISDNQNKYKVIIKINDLSLLKKYKTIAYKNPKVITYNQILSNWTYHFIGYIIK